MESGKAPVTEGYSAYETEGVTLWIPDFMAFKNDEVIIDLKGFLWAANLVVVSALLGQGSGCGSCSYH